MRANATYLVILAAAVILALSSSASATLLPVVNPSFEINSGNGTAPAYWSPVSPIGPVVHDVYTGEGFNTTDGTYAVLSGIGAYHGYSQITENYVQANTVYTLTADFIKRAPHSPWTINFGGYWLCIRATDGTNAYILASGYGNGGWPSSGVPITESVQATVGANLSSVPTISSITGTAPDGFADLSSGQYKIDIVVDADYPEENLYPSGYQVAWQTLIDNVRLDGTVVPEPSTLALLACGLTGLLCYAWRKRR